MAQAGVGRWTLAALTVLSGYLLCDLEMSGSQLFALGSVRRDDRFQMQAAIADTPKGAFEVATVKVSAPKENQQVSISKWGSPRFTASYVTLKLLVELAYDIDAERLSNCPEWFDERRYDINAVAPAGEGLTYDAMKPLLQHLLEERFQLKFHHQKKEVQGFILTVGKKGPHLTPGRNRGGAGFYNSSGLYGPNVSMEELAIMLAHVVAQPVLDKTRVEGKYIVKLEYSTDESETSSFPSIYTALQEQQGLKLIKQKVQVDVMVVDHADSAPTEN